MLHKRPKVALFATVCAVAMAHPAFAQDTAAAEQPTSSEIVVTAQNRAQNVQDVPIAMSVVTGEEVASAGVTDFTSLQRIAPVLNIVNDTQLTKVSIRGVGTLAHGPTQDQSVAVNIDGEYINRPTVLNAALFDLDRVEVLRGPQGTLYGRNSTGGAVNFIVRKPGKEFGVNASATYGSYNLVQLEGGVDLPLGDVAAIRLSGIFADRDGYVRHPNTPTQINSYVPSTLTRSDDDHRWGGRASLRLTPADGLTVDASYERIETRVHQASQAWINLNAAGNNSGTGPGCTNGWVEVGLATPGTQCTPKNTNFLASIDRSTYNSPLSGVGFVNRNSDAVRGRVAYDLGAATLSYIGGYRETETEALMGLSPAYVSRVFNATVKTQSHELRLNGQTSGVTWQTGLFYFREKLANSGGLYSPYIGPKGGYINYVMEPTDNKSWSAFGQVEVPLTEQLTAVGGLRYTDDRRETRYTRYPFSANTGLVPLPTTTITPNYFNPTPYENDKVTWLAGLNYQPNTDTLVYAKVASGYKAGGFDGTGNQYQAETNTAYEGGAKLNFGAESQHIFNLAGFFYDYRDLQNDILLNPNIGGQTFNAGKAQIWGVEADAAIKLLKNGTFTVSVNYLNAEYKEFRANYNVSDPASPGTTAINQTLYPADAANLAGNKIPFSPNWTIVVGYDHVFDLASGATLTASANSTFKSSYFSSLFNYRDTQEKSYTQTDLSLEFKPASKAYSVQAFVRNLEDHRALAYANYTAAASDDIFNWQFGAPRTYGVRLSVDF